MAIISVWYLWVALGAMAFLHIVSVLADSHFSIHAISVNIGLHIVAFFLLLRAKAPIEESVLFYMVSLFIYVLSYEVKHLATQALDRRKSENVGMAEAQPDAKEDVSQPEPICNGIREEGEK